MIAKVVEINLAEIKEPIPGAPNDPDDAPLPSEIADDKVDEVFLGSCMTNIGHFRALGARTEMPSCSLCMGNQARVAASSTVLPTPTRNFLNRLGDDANVYLTSAELPTPAEYQEYAKNINSMAAEIYRYLNFDQIEEFQKSAEEGKRIAAVEIQDVAV